LDTLLEAGSDQATDQATDQVKQLLKVANHEFRSATELMAALSLRHRPTFRKNYLQPALEKGLLEAKYPHNPRHPAQAYRLKMP
jgi:hypothetical protein